MRAAVFYVWGSRLMIAEAFAVGKGVVFVTGRDPRGVPLAGWHRRGALDPLPVRG
jgi:hypothetical protein